MMRTFKVGQYVDIVGIGSVHKGMPHKTYHGRTGKIWNVTPRAIGVEVNKRVRERIIRKRIHVRVQHARPSACNDDYLKRRAERAKGNKVGKRIPAQPLAAHFVRLPGTTAEEKLKQVKTVTPIRYVLLV